MKKIISFSLWGDNVGYCVGAVENARRQPRIYPGWVCRFYCDSRVPKDIIEQLLNLGSEVVMKPESDDFMGLYWRFEPMFDDPEIERFIVRDTDSRINLREASAVKEWEDSGLPFHVMRDNPAHNIRICGGMWGAKAGAIPEFQVLMDAFIKLIEPDTCNPRGKYHGTDQVFLGQYIWPFIEKSHVAHDENHNFSGKEKPFKVKLRRNGYIGMVYTTMDADRCEAVEA